MSKDRSVLWLSVIAFFLIGPSVVFLRRVLAGEEPVSNAISAVIMLALGAFALSLAYDDVRSWLGRGKRRKDTRP